MRSRQLTVQSIGVWSFARLGCAVGWLVAFLPSALVAFLVWTVLTAIQTWLQNIPTLQILTVRVDFVSLLGLQNLQSTLIALDVASLGFLLTLAVALALVAGIIVGISILLVALGYNLLAWLSGGGVVLTVVEKPNLKNSE